ncbi:hypothetical protein [Nonomuraea solani]|uniref:hypothetical protein n=1 Tax=Nonomuraea solani TaxID=1144553 RepID=UPI000CDEB020|nr:hypothetical protein [Nonomuraea solani]
MAYPSPTTSRFVLLLAALLSAGAFAGGWLHDRVHPGWPALILRCESEADRRAAVLTPEERRALAPGGPAVNPAYELVLARQVLAARCRASLEQRRAVYGLAGAVGAGVAGVALLVLAPVVIQRRRRLRPLVPILPEAASRIATLAAEAGLRRPPVALLGTAALRDGYSYGRPGRYRLVLPQAAAVRWRDSTLFDPLVRHELAHIAYGDVTLAWLARSIGYVLAPLLLVPAVIIALSDDRTLLPGYLLRIGLLGLTALLVSSALLRSREHDADLRAARAGGGPETFAGIVGRMRGAGVTWYRRPLAYHPSPARRRAVLARPELAVSVTALDGLAAGFLAALIIPQLVSALTWVFSEASRTDLALVVPAVTVGLLLGSSVGLGLWRATLLTRTPTTGPRPDPVTGGTTGETAGGGAGKATDGAAGSAAAGMAGGVAGGVAVGLVVGQVVGLPQTGLEPSWTILVVGWAGFGATVLSAGLGELWADAAPALSRRASWVIALAVNWVLFGVVLWLAGQLELVLDQGGWEVARMWFTSMPGTWPALAAIGALALVSAWGLVVSRRRGVLMPRWLLETGEPSPWPVRPVGGVLGVAMVAGVVSALVCLVFGLVMGPVDTDAARIQRFFTYLWIVAAAVVAAALAAPRRARLLAGPLAGLVGGVGYLAVNGLFGGRLTVAFVLAVLPPPLVIGFVCMVFTALPFRSREPGVRRGAVVQVPAPVRGEAVARIPVPVRGGVAGRLSASVGRVGFGPVRRGARVSKNSVRRVVAALGLGLAATGVVIAAREPLAGGYALPTVVPTPPITPEPAADAKAEAARYVYERVPAYLDRLQEMRSARNAILATPPSADRAVRMRTEAVSQARAMLADAQAYRPEGAETRAAHQEWIAFLRAQHQALDLLATALETGATTSPEAAAKEAEALGHFQRWGSKVTTMAGGG